MASTVRYLLEESVPELQALVDGGIFTRDETRAIVARRQAFEYALKRRTPVLDDFIRYVNYEASLNKLRRHRVASSALASGSGGGSLNLTAMGTSCHSRMPTSVPGAL